MTKNVLTVTFVLDENPVGQFVGAGVGAIELVAAGKFTWKQP